MYDYSTDYKHLHKHSPNYHVYALYAHTKSAPLRTGTVQDTTNLAALLNQPLSDMSGLGRDHAKTTCEKQYVHVPKLCPKWTCEVGIFVEALRWRFAHTNTIHLLLNNDNKLLIYS